MAGLDLPRGWEYTDPPAGVKLLAHTPRTGAFVSNLTVTVETNGDLSFRDWQVGVDMAFGQMFPGYTPVDLEALTIDGHRGGRRLAIYDGPGGVPLALEQWFVDIGGVGHTLTATVAIAEYATWADPLAKTASSWSPGAIS